MAQHLQKVPIPDTFGVQVQTDRTQQSELTKAGTSEKKVYIPKCRVSLLYSMIQRLNSLKLRNPLSPKPLTLNPKPLNPL